MNKARYIVFLIDGKYKEHHGRIFSDLREAKEFCSLILNKDFADKAIIGMFEMNPNVKELFVSHVETIGFPKDKKKTDQLNLFNSFATI
jgi:hypothetical protein